MPQFYFQGIEPIPKLPFQMLSTHLHLALTQDADLYGIGSYAFGFQLGSANRSPSGQLDRKM